MIYGADNCEDVIEHLDYLMKTHAWEDIRVKCRMIHNVLMTEKEKLQQDDDDDDDDLT